MKRKHNGLLVISVCGVVLSAVAVAACLLLLFPLRQKADQVRTSLHNVEIFTEDPWEEPFVNREAESLFAVDRTQKEEEKDVLASYTSPEGIEFLSMSEKWDQENLEKLYQELLKNKHGEELYSLSSVFVYPQEDDFAAATHQNVSQIHPFYLDFPALPRGFQFLFERTEGVITLYNGDRNVTPESMASSLSHEYGHHFTFYHMFSSWDNEEQLLQSEYAKLRNLPSGQLLTDQSDAAFYSENHHWYLIEIAAEDYVTLMGSPNSRDIGEFHDVKEYLGGDGQESGAMLRNAMPQENMMIPLASDVEGLAEYFYSFTDSEMPQIPSKQDFHLSVQRNAEGYDLVTGYEEFVSYQLIWDKVYGEDAVYTLISYQEENYKGSFYPIKTVEAGENSQAWIGCVAEENGGVVSYTDDGLAAGTRTFMVTAILPDGTIAVSEPLNYTF